MAPNLPTAFTKPQKSDRIMAILAIIREKPHLLPNELLDLIVKTFGVRKSTAYDYVRRAKQAWLLEANEGSASGAGLVTDSR